MSFIQLSYLWRTGQINGKPLEYRHKACGHKFEPVMVCSVCREPLHAKQVQVSAGPGYFAYMEQKQKQA